MAAPFSAEVAMSERFWLLIVMLLGVQLLSVSAAVGGRLGLARRRALRNDEDLGVTGNEVTNARAGTRVIHRPRRTDASTTYV